MFEAIVEFHHYTSVTVEKAAVACTNVIMNKYFLTTLHHVHLSVPHAKEYYRINFFLKKRIEKYLLYTYSVVALSIGRKYLFNKWIFLHFLLWRILILILLLRVTRKRKCVFDKVNVLNKRFLIKSSRVPSPARWISLFHRD